MQVTAKVIREADQHRTNKSFAEAAGTGAEPDQGGLVGAVIAYFVGGHYIDHPDVYILNQQLTQTVIFGAAIGSNVFAAGLSLYDASRSG